MIKKKKPLQKVSIEGTYLNITKAIYGKSTNSIILNVEKWKHSKNRNKTRVSTAATFIQHSFGSPSHGNQRRKINKRDQNWKRSSKTATICRWRTIHRNAKNTIIKLLELINKFGKVLRYKINMQKSLPFLYHNSEILEREIKETILLIIISNRIKYLGINLSKEENTYTLKPIRCWWKKSNMIQRDIPYLWIRRINIA